MAEYVPFPSKEDEVVTDRSLRNKILGCFGCGGAGVAGFLGVMVLLFSASPGGCAINIDGDPGKGTRSARVAVEVTPAKDLVDRTTVRVTSDAFEPDSIVGIAVCLRTADTQRRGVDACDEVQGARYATSAAGRLDATYPVPRVITLGDRAYDCAASSGRCLVVAASANDYNRSGGKPITFRSGRPLIDLDPVGARPASDRLPVAASPTGPVRDGASLEVTASGFQPGEPLLIAYCTDDLDSRGVAASCEPLDASNAVSAIVLRSLGGDFLRADEAGAVTTTVGVRSSVAPFGDDLGKALSRYSSTTTTTAVTATTTPGATTTTVPGSVRCDTSPGRCSIVIAAAADAKRSAVLPYTLAAG